MSQQQNPESSIPLGTSSHVSVWLFTLAPLQWLNVEETCCYWPPKTAGKFIRRNEPYNETWIQYPIQVIKKYDTYEQAINKEKKMMESTSSSSQTDDNDNEIRNKRKRKRTSVFNLEGSDNENENNHIYDNNSTETNLFLPTTTTKKQLQKFPISNIDDTSDESFEMPPDAPDDVDITLTNNLLDRQSLNISDLPVVLDNMLDNPVLNAILDNVLKIKNMVISMQQQINNLESNNKLLLNEELLNNGRNDDLISNYLPIKVIDELNNFDNLLKENKDAEGQLYKLLIHVGGNNFKNCVQRCLAKVFSNDIARKCSWTGAKNNFKISDLQLMRILKNSVKKNFPNSKEAEYEEIVKTWFRHGTQRFSRDTKKKNDENNDPNIMDQTK